MSKTIVITGVTGVQGSSIAHTFLGFPEWRVRGITRSPSGKAAQTLEANGVEIVVGNFNDRQSLLTAFVGATVIFSNTDYFSLLRNELKPNDTRTPNEINQRAFDLEVAQGLNIAEAAASPEVLKTLKRFILSYLSDATRWSGGKYTTVFHFDSKPEMARRIESQFPQLAARMSKLQVGHYITNWKAFPSMAPQKQADGGFLTFRPVPPTAKFPFIVPHRDMGVFVKALVDLPPRNHLLGVSEITTFAEWMTLWGKIHGVKAGFMQVAGEEFFKGVPEAYKKELWDTFNYISEFGFTGGDPEVSMPSQLDIKIPVTSMEEYINSEDWSTALSS
ncbi:putative hscarg dehydrogenase [Bisporella sp. PMI_857]|nr:putative hscarg dehydrogenase [Bisporella sp. PMI_857]